MPGRRYSASASPNPITPGPSQLTDTPDLVPLATIAPAMVEALLDRAFGRDRFARTAYAVRSDAAALPHLSFAAIGGGALVGSIQCWPVALHADDAAAVPLVMVGPVAVDPARQGDGLGRRLVAAAIAAARPTGEAERLMLIGDPGYYARFFGFSAAQTGRWRLPGPFDPARLLALGAEVPDLPGRLGRR